MAELATVLTETLARLSPTRINIIGDQLRAALKSDRREDLIVLAASTDATSLESSLVLVAAVPEQGDTGAVLHADWAYPDRPGDASLAVAYATAVAKRLFQIFSAHQVRFIQWPTDPEPIANFPTETAADHSVLAWPRRMGFAIVGTLEYMTLDLNELKQDAVETLKSPPRTSLEPFDHTSDDSATAYEQTVRATYQDSLDCPLLERYRSSSDMVESYRHADAFSPNLWFNVCDDGDSSRSVVGCVILAKHADTATSDLVLELVYMGVLPQHRGQNFGAEIMRHVLDLCERERAVRLILAVDQQNHPAVTAYKRLGMKGLFRETVWVHSGRPQSVTA